jgi:hypothetical protein
MVIHNLNLTQGAATLIVTKERMINSWGEQRMIVLHLRLKNLDSSYLLKTPLFLPSKLSQPNRSRRSQWRAPGSPRPSASASGKTTELISVLPQEAV